ncbi:Ral guanine nucleotide dissociation stimulator [Balamuthia mandrillaris]
MRPETGLPVAGLLLGMAALWYRLGLVWMCALILVALGLAAGAAHHFNRWPLFLAFLLWWRLRFQSFVEELFCNNTAKGAQRDQVTKGNNQAKEKEEEEAVQEKDYPFRDNEVEEEEGKEVVYQSGGASTSFSSSDQLRPRIKGATLNKLIEKITTIEAPDPELVTAFLLTYRGFCTPQQLLELLVLRYKVPLQRESRYREAIQARVQYITKKWAEDHYYDFENDEQLLKRLNAFVSLMSRSSSTAITKFADVLRLYLSKASKNEKLAMRRVHGETLPAPKVPYGGHTGPISNVMEVNPLEFARQLTILEFQCFVKIQPKECMGLAWSKKDKQEKAPNVLFFIESFNRISKWVVSQILAEEALKQRAKVLEHFIQILLHCKELQNYNAMMEINAGLHSSSVGRLKQTWKLLPTKLRVSYEESFSDMMQSNYKKLRDMLLSSPPPCIPYIGVFLTDLTFIEDGNKDMLTSHPHLINFEKRQMQSRVIEQIKLYQKKAYALQPVDRLQTFIRTLSSELSDEAAYQRSLQLEPRQQKT